MLCKFSVLLAVRVGAMATCERCGAESTDELCDDCRLLVLTPDEAQARFDEEFGDGSAEPDGDEITDIAAIFHVNTSRVNADTNEYWPDEYFEQAGPDVRDELIRRVEAEDGEVNSLLVRLANIGDDVVVRRFRDWTENPPRWTQNLYVPVAEYAHEANWELVDGERRSLTFGTVLVLRRGSAAIVGPGEGACPNCETTLFTAVDLPDASAYDLPGHVRIRLCPTCVIFSSASDEREGRSHYRFDLDGGGMLDVELEDDVESEAAVTVAWEVDPVAVASPWRAGTWDARAPVIGGRPSWEQDAEYDECPDCGRTMRHLAWLPMHELTDGGTWGSVYVQVCTECRVASGSFQTT